MVMLLEGTFVQTKYYTIPAHYVDYTGNLISKIIMWLVGLKSLRTQKKKLYRMNIYKEQH